MQTTAVQQSKAIPPVWGQLKNLSNKNKQILIDLLKDSMVEPKKETFEEAWVRSIDIEDFRKLCDKEIDRLYGKK